MLPLRVYLDTSVIGGAFDAEFQKDTDLFLQQVRRGAVRVVVSEQVEAELKLAPREVRGLLAELYGLGAERLLVTGDARALAGAYLAAGVVSPKYLADALHIALATLARVDVLVSWNFKHIVNLRRIRGFNGVNLLRGHGTLEIRSPREVTGDESL